MRKIVCLSGRKESPILLCIVSAVILTTSVILSGIDKSYLASDYHPLSDEGALVRLAGTVEELRITKTGGHIAASVNGTSVFIPADVAEKVSLHEGDIISLYGVVQTYRGEKEVVVNSPEDITIRSTR